MKSLGLERILKGTLLGIFTFLCFAAVSEAAQYDIKQMTPEVEKAIANRQARYSELQGLKAEGSVGENNKGYAEALGDSSSAKSIASAENEDRKVIYRTIAEQNNLGAEGLALIETVFAEVQHEKARAGDPVQDASGAWGKK